MPTNISKPLPLTTNSVGRRFTVPFRCSVREESFINFLEEARHAVVRRSSYPPPVPCCFSPRFGTMSFEKNDSSKMFRVQKPQDLRHYLPFWACARPTGPLELSRSLSTNRISWRREAYLPESAPHGRRASRPDSTTNKADQVHGHGRC